MRSRRKPWGKDGGALQDGIRLHRPGVLLQSALCGVVLETRSAPSACFQGKATSCACFQCQKSECKQTRIAGEACWRCCNNMKLSWRLTWDTPAGSKCRTVNKTPAWRLFSTKWELNLFDSSGEQLETSLVQWIAFHFFPSSKRQHFWCYSWAKTGQMQEDQDEIWEPFQAAIRFLPPPRLIAAIKVSL